MNTNTRNEVECRAYSKPSRWSRKVAGVPVSRLSVILAASVIVAAVITLMGPISTNHEQSPQVIQIDQGTTKPWAATAPYGQVQDVLTVSWMSGYASAQLVHVLLYMH